MSDAQVLAELMGYTAREITDGRQADFWELLKPDGTRYMSGAANEDMAMESGPRFPTDLNAMREAWKVLKEQGLWDEFVDAWSNQSGMDGLKLFHDWLYEFLTDLPGQVKAAIKVLKEAQG